MPNSNRLPMKENSLPLAVVMGASPTGLAVARSLGQLGIRIRVADFKADRPAFASKYCHGLPITADSVLEVIENVLAETSQETIPPIVIPTSDAMVLGLVEHRERYAGKLRTYQAIENGLAAAVTDKASFYQQCLDAEVPTAKTAFPQNATEMIALSENFQYPLLIKPVLGHLWRDRLNGQKLLVANSSVDLQGIVDWFGDDADGLMVQELIPGPEEDIWIGGVYRGDNGQHDGCFVGQKTRQYPPNFGSASYAKSLYKREIEELSWKFLDAIDYRGICGTEFKLDRRDGQYKIIEVNPRPTLWFHLVSAAGMNLFEHAFCDLAGQRLATPMKSQIPGVRWCFQDKDFLTWKHHLQRLNLSPLLTTFSPWNHGAVVSLRDPKPFLTTPLYYLRRIRERYFSR